MRPEPDSDASGFAAVRSEFHRLADLDADARTRELAALAARNPGLASSVAALFERFDIRDLEAPQALQKPVQLGPFRVLRQIGRGGMGDVFHGERNDGAFEQQVALKLIRADYAGLGLDERFRRERQILARLQHPHIARLIDGGVGAGGQAWLAMEFVDGVDLATWVASGHPDLRRRIALFIKICDAVAFAHRALIVHRDLKPANVLVAGDDEPKLLDFGIAKLIDDEADAQTRTVMPALTLRYAAPEQVLGDRTTTATDVYALGVLLFELIAGVSPYVAAQDGQTSWHEAIVRGQVRPLAAAMGERSHLANPEQRLAARDLTRVIARAMALAPSDRYSSAAALGEDLRDWLDDRPLRSGVGTLRERMRLQLHRYRWPLLSAAAVFAALAIGIVLVLREARAKAHEADVSQQTTQFLIGLFEGADPTVARGASLSAQDLLDQGNARLHGATRLQPLVRARLLRTVADSYVALGHYDRALSPAEEALTVRQAEGAAVDRADSLDQVGNILRLRADYARAEPMLREALELRRSLLLDDDPATIDSIAHLAAMRSAKGDFKAADALFAEATRAARSRFGEDSVETARHLDNYAGNLDDMGQRSEALALLRRVLAIRVRVLGPDHADVATTLASLGVHLSGSGHNDEAIVLLERALAIRRTIYGAAHPLVAFAAIDLAGTYADQGRLDKAELLAQEALATARAGLSPEHPKVSEALNMLGLIRIMRRDYAGAIGLQQEVVQRLVASEGEDHPNTLTAMNNLAYGLVRAGRAAEAETLLRAVIARKRDDNGQGAHGLQNLATALSLQGKHAEAVEWQRRAMAMQEAREGKASVAVAVALRELAITREWAGVDAERDYRAALAMAEAVDSGHDLALHGWKFPLAAFLVGSDLVGSGLVGADRCSEALPLLQEAMAELGDDTVEAETIKLPQARLLLGACAAAADHAAAEASMAQACQSLLTLPGVEVDVFPTTRKLLTTRCH